jgi:hypothetical protein
MTANERNESVRTPGARDRIASRAVRAWRAAALVLLLGAALPAAAELRIATSINPGQARPGEIVDVEITVTNTDAVARTGVTVSIVYPAGLNAVAPANFGGSCPPSFCEPGETITWSLGTLQAGRSITVDLPTSVAAATADGTLIDFDFVVTDQTLQMAQSTSTLRVETATLYDVALRDDADPVAPNALLTYKLTFGYREEALSIAQSGLRFPVPAGTTFVSATGGGSFSAGVVEWNLGQLLPGEGGVREVTVRVNAPQDTVIEATAAVFDSANPAESATAEALTVVDTGRLLSVDVDANADPARPGEQLNVRFVVTNHDAVTRLNLSLRVRYPDGVSSVATSNINGASCPPSFCDPGEQVVYAIPSLAPGQAITLELPPFVAATTPDGTLINFFAMLSDPTGGNASGIDSVRVRTQPRYDLALRDSADPIGPGANLAYKLTYGYREEALTLATSTLRMRLPRGTSFVSASDGGTFANGFVTWDVGTLAPGDGGTREVVVQVNAADRAVLQASAEIFDAALPVEQAAAEKLTIVDATPPLAVTIDANADPARPNELLNVLAVVANRDTVARTVTLRLRYPDGLASVASANVSGASCPPSFCDPGEIVTWSLGSIAPGKTMTVEIAPFVASTTPDGQLINFIAIANDTAGGNASAADTVRVRTSPSYDLAIRESADPVAPGALLTYKLSFGYREEAPVIASTTLRFRLAPGTSFVSATEGGFLAGEDVVEWNLGSLAPGEGGIRELTVAVDAPNGAVLQAAASIHDTGDPVEQAAFEALTTVEANAPISVQVDVNADPGRPVPQDMLNVQYVVTNHDVVPRNITLHARYPDNAGAVAVSNLGWSPAGSCPPSFCDQGEILTYAFGNVAPGQSVTVEMAPFVPTTSPDGLLVNFFAIATDTAGGVATSTDTMRVNGASRYDLTIRDSADAVQPGAELTWKMTFGYRADAPSVADSRLRFRLPAGVSFLSATAGGMFDGEYVVWDLGLMNPGDGGIRSVTALVDAPDASVLQAQAEIFAASSPVQQALAEALTTVDANPPLALDVRALTNPSHPNTATTFQLTVTNRDAIARTVTLRARYPDGVFSVAPSAFTPAGSCPPSFCDPGEMVTWTLGTINAGASVVVTMPMTVLNTAINGQLVSVFAIATDTAGGIATGVDTARNGVCTDDDSDCDGFADGADNCLFADNADQRDTDGDGIGNACDADLDQNCAVNFLDLGAFKSRFLTNDPHADFNGDGLVNFGDLGVLKKQFFRAPGPSGVPNICAAAR